MKSTILCTYCHERLNSHSGSSDAYIVRGLKVLSVYSQQCMAIIEGMLA